MKMLAFIIVTVLLDQVVSDDPTTKYGLELDHPGTSCADIYEKNPVSHWIICNQNKQGTACLL